MLDIKKISKDIKEKYEIYDEMPEQEQLKEIRKLNKCLEICENAQIEKDMIRDLGYLMNIINNKHS